MKKKILSLIIAVLLIVPCLALNISAAATPEISILNNGQNLEYQGNNYVRFDASLVDFDIEEYLDDVQYNLGNIKSADYEFSYNKAIIRAYFTYNDGSMLTASFINDNFYYSEYQRMITNPDKFTVDFYYPDDNTVTANSEAFFGEVTSLYGDDLWYSDQMDVTVNAEDNSFYINKGCLFILDDTYYYYDYEKAGITDPYSFNAYDVEGWIEVYKITDSHLCLQLDEAYNEYNSDFIGLLGSDFTESFAIVLLVLVFAVIPLAALIVFLILAIRAKTPSYKKLFTVIYITAATGLVVFVITVLLITFLK